MFESDSDGYGSFMGRYKAEQGDHWWDGAAKRRARLRARA
jgi:hypothetical protein